MLALNVGRSRLDVGCFALEFRLSTLNRITPSSHRIQRTTRPNSGLGHHMRINLRRLDALVPHQLLNSPQISVPGVQQVGGKTVPQGMTSNRLVDPHQSRRRLDRPLHQFLIGVMAPDNAATGISRELFGWKDPHPRPFLAGLRILLLQRIRHHHSGHPLLFEFCLGRSYRVEDVDEHGHFILDVSADIDQRFGGSQNDIRIEAEFLEELS